MSIGFVDKSQVEVYRSALNADAEFRYATSRMSADILLRVGLERCFMEIRSGQVPSMTVVNTGEYVLRNSDTQIGASEQIWGEILKAEPAPGYHDLIPAVAWYGLELSGDIDVQNIFRQAMTRLVTLFREIHSGERKEFVLPELPAHGTVEPIVGKYVYVDVVGTTYRIYFEEAGDPNGIPLICQHTAGTDGRQWRRLLNDPAVTDRYHVIVHDLPFHGKSLPPEGEPWWTRPYELDEALGLEFPVALSNALGLERPVYIGASIGGMIASDLPWKHPGYFRAVIACEAGEYMPQWEAQIPSLSDPRARNATSDMSYCQAPTVPVQNIHENNFLNDSCAYGVVAGDVNYYAYVHDLRDKFHLFDTSSTAVYILNGEYDLATPPIVGDALAEKIKGAKSIHLMGLGHFPHCEDYPLFATYLYPVLDEILSAGG